MLEIDDRIVALQVNKLFYGRVGRIISKATGSGSGNHQRHREC